jgi:transposase
MNRIRSLLVLHNLRPHIIGGRERTAWWEHHGLQVPRELRAEIEREIERLALVKRQVKAMEAERRQELADGKQPLMAQLAQLRAIGPNGAWVLVKELFGWRRFTNRSKRLLISKMIQPHEWRKAGAAWSDRRLLPGA